MHSDGGSTTSETDPVDPDAPVELTIQGQRLLQRLLAEASAEPEADDEY